MEKMKIRLICIFAVILLLIIALPTGVYAYKNNQYKSDFNKAASQLDNEKYDEAINAFNDISKTYFGKKNSEKIKKEIEKAEKFKENKKVYDEALKLFNDKKYLEAIDGFKKIPKGDPKRYEKSTKKIEECKSLYISLNLENAKNEVKSNNYDSAVKYLDLVLALDAANKDAIALKDEYIKAKEAAELKAKQEAEAKAAADAKAKAEANANAKAKAYQSFTIVQENNGASFFIRGPVSAAGCKVEGVILMAGQTFPFCFIKGEMYSEGDYSAYRYFFLTRLYESDGVKSGTKLKIDFAVEYSDGRRYNLPEIEFIAQ